VTKKEENRITFDVSTTKQIDETVERDIKKAVSDALDTDGEVTLDIQSGKKRLFASTVTATIDEEGSNAFAISGLVSLLVTFVLAALF